MGGTAAGPRVGPMVGAHGAGAPLDAGGISWGGWGGEPSRDAVAWGIDGDWSSLGRFIPGGDARFLGGEGGGGRWAMYCIRGASRNSDGWGETKR